MGTDCALHSPMCTIESVSPCSTEKTTIDTGSPFPTAVLALTVTVYGTPGSAYTRVNCMAKCETTIEIHNRIRRLIAKTQSLLTNVNGNFIAAWSGNSYLKL